MKGAGSKRSCLYYAVAVWAACNLLLLLKGYLGTSYDSTEATGYSFFVGLLVLLFLYRRATG